MDIMELLQLVLSLTMEIISLLEDLIPWFYYGNPTFYQAEEKVLNNTKDRPNRPNLLWKTKKLKFRKRIKKLPKKFRLNRLFKVAKFYNLVMLNLVNLKLYFLTLISLSIELMSGTLITNPILKLHLLFSLNLKINKSNYLPWFKTLWTKFITN